MIGQHHLVDIFSEDEVLLAPVDVVENHVTDLESWRVFTEVGILNGILWTLAFEDPPRTLAKTLLTIADQLPERLPVALTHEQPNIGNFRQCYWINRAMSGAAAVRASVSSAAAIGD